MNSNNKCISVKAELHINNPAFGETLLVITLRPLQLRTVTQSILAHCKYPDKDQKTSALHCISKEGGGVRRGSGEPMP